ncbi:MAG TPA: ribosome-associated translation inhibitor RaiA [Patescibacteria group bacterium]|nr:ribosome-associated translation inhibitor RaiA [Patescibacteria group bacterium]
MNITFKATNTTLTDSIRTSFEEKLSHLEKFLKPEDKIHVEVEVDQHHNSGDVFRVEIHIKPGGQYAEAAGSDFYEALDLCLPKIKEQLAKAKDKKVSLRRRIANVFKS